MNKMRYKEIFKKSLANKLNNRDNKYEARVNLKNPKYDVFIFYI